MKVVFYSEQCEYCRKLLSYLDKHGIKSMFKLVNIDKTDAPKEIDIVPTIIDTELNQPLKGKKAFEYLLNIKYFNNPTNNVEYLKELPPNPNIPEDEKAEKGKIINLEINNNNTSINTDSYINDMFTSSKNTNLVSEKTRTNNNNIVIPKYNDLINFDKNTDNKEPNESTQFYEQNKNNSISKTTQEMVAQRNVQDKKMSILLQMKKR